MLKAKCNHEQHKKQDPVHKLNVEIGPQQEKRWQPEKRPNAPRSAVLVQQEQFDSKEKYRAIGGARLNVGEYVLRGSRQGDRRPKSSA